jgi:hypothetical protein
MAVPNDTPVTTPEPDTVASGEPVDHVPPAGLPVRLTEDPTQVPLAPVITGLMLTVIVRVMRQLVGSV